MLAVTPTERIKTALFVPPMFHVAGPQFANVEREWYEESTMQNTPNSSSPAYMLDGY